MATLPSPDPERYSEVHVLRRPAAKPVDRDSRADRPPLAPWRTWSAKLLTAVQIAAMLYGFFILALVAGATPKIDYAGSGEIAIPGLPWFIRALGAIAVFWVCGIAKGVLLKRPHPWNYHGTELGWALMALFSLGLVTLASAGIVWPLVVYLLIGAGVGIAAIGSK
jgi:hypothetical protein